MQKYSIHSQKLRHSIWLIVTLFVLLGFLFPNVGGNTFFALLTGPQTTVNSPPVVLQSGTAGTSTIYTNSTSAKVSVQAPLLDYVDDNDCNVDSSADKGMHSNFTGQQYGPDSIYDTLKEENTEAIEDYVDNNASDVDNSANVGTHSNFESQKLMDGVYDTLTEAIEEIIRDGVTQEQSTSATVTFSHTLAYSSGNNRLVVVAAGFENSAGDINIGSATYNGQSMTKIVQVTSGGAGTVASVALFYLLDSSLPPNSGSYSVVVTAASNPSADLWASAVSYTGVKQGAPDDYDSDFSASSTTMTSSLTCDESGSMLIQACIVGNTGSFTPSSGTTEVIEDGDINSASAVLDEKLDQDSGARDLGCTHSNMNRGSWVGACWASASTDYDLDVEVQFVSVIDFLPTERLCIYTGTLGSEDLRVDYWNGTGWENLATDLTAFSCNEYTVSLTSTNFTTRFKGGSESSDATQDQWQIDAALLRVEGAGSKKDAVDQQSNSDGLADVGTHSNFAAQQAGPDSISDTLTEWNAGGAINTTLIDAESFEGSWSPTGWTETASSNWNRENDYAHSGTYSADFDGPGFGTASGDLDTPNLNCTGVNAIYVDFWYRDHLLDADDFLLQYYNGSSWNTISDLGSTTQEDQWLHYQQKITGNQYFVPTFRVRWSAVSVSTGENIWVDLVTIKKETSTPDDFELDLEVQWIDLLYSLPNEELCIYGGTMGAENIKVDVWNGTGWENVFNDLSIGWNNQSITDWLTSSDFTIRFKGGNETGDTDQDTWQIDVAIIHTWHNGSENYELNLEVQWTSADYARTNEELCIKTRTFSGSENIRVKIWNTTGSSWHWVMNLTANQWNNVSITSYLTSSTLTVQFLGGTETGDTAQDSWNIDATLLSVWTDDATFNYVLRVNNTKTDSWQIRLKKYSDSNINRLQSCTIYFHNTSDGTSRQIYIEDGSYTNQTGPWYDLGDSETIYIAMTVEATSTGTSYVRTYLEILIPDKTTYAQYVLTFEFT
jgi:hypothetical protein